MTTQSDNSDAKSDVDLRTITERKQPFLSGRRPEPTDLCEDNKIAADSRAPYSRGQWTVIWSMAVLLLVCVALTVWALWRIDQAQDKATEQAQLTARAEEAVATAVAENERLTRSIRADHLTAHGLKAVEDSLPLALLLGVEGLRAQNDFTPTLPYTATRIIYDFDQAAYITTTAVITGGETVAGSAQSNMHEILGKTRGVALSGHTYWITAVAVSPDGRWVATGSDDDTARLWDLSAVDPAHDPIILRGHTDEVEVLAFSPDGRWLATGSGDSYTRLWDLRSADPAQAPIILHGHRDGIRAVAFSADSRWVATGSWDRTARLWNLEAVATAQDAVVLQGHKSIVTSLAFSPDGHWLVTGSADETARLWNLSAVDPARDPVILSVRNGAKAVAFSPDGRWLATGDSMAQLWDLSAVDPFRNPMVLQGNVRAMAFSPDGRWFATAGSNVARFWDLKAAEPARNRIVLEGHRYDVTSLAISPDSRWLATGSVDDTARLWDLHAADPTRAPAILRGHESVVEAVAFSPDSRWLVTGSWDETARLWDLRPAYQAQEPIVLQDHADSVQAVAFSPDGRWLASGSDDGTVQLADVSAVDLAQESTVLRGHTGSVYAVAFGPGGRWLATGSGDKTVRLWDMRAASPTDAPVVLRGHAGSVVSIAFSPDGRWLATGSSDSTARLWDISSANPTQGHLVLSGHVGSVVAVAFSPDGRWLATGSNGESGDGDIITVTHEDTTHLWDIAAIDLAQDHVALRSYTLDGRAVAFSPDGRWLATGSVDNTAQLWRIDATVLTLNPVILRSHVADKNAELRRLAFSPDARWLTTNLGDIWDISAADPAQSLISLGYRSGEGFFSPDSRWLATASGDAARLWNLSAPDPAQDPIVLRGHKGDISALALSPDGRALATGDRFGDHTVRLWRLRVEELIALACRSAGRNLTADEWQRYLGAAPYHRTCEQWPIHSSVTQFLRNAARHLAEQGDIVGARTKLDEALVLDPDLKSKSDAVWSWDALCRYGSLYGHAAEVLDACNTAVSLAGDASFRDSRGLARALAGDVPGAIEDFEIALQRAGPPFQGTAFIDSRSGWVEALRAGKDPAVVFNQKILDILKGK